MGKGGGYYAPPPSVPPTKRTKPRISLLTEREVELLAADGCDRKIGYGIWEPVGSDAYPAGSPPPRCKAGTPATHRIVFHCPRRDRRDDAIVCGKCAARFALAHDLELP